MTTWGTGRVIQGGSQGQGAGWALLHWSQFLILLPGFNTLARGPPGMPHEPCCPHTCRMVKFSRTLFIMYFSGRCFSLWMKLIMYSQSGDRWMRYE